MIRKHSIIRVFSLNHKFIHSHRSNTHTYTLLSQSTHKSKSSRSAAVKLTQRRAYKTNMYLTPKPPHSVCSSMNLTNRTRLERSRLKNLNNNLAKEVQNRGRLENLKKSLIASNTGWSKKNHDNGKNDGFDQK